ncbi:uncharacterized protein LOC125509030 isoform X3 [Triticum urartu]|uniref:uncharacterized protein LOC125509030 isoform X3 n=1 Tax=Triticum urartu TaxID=4572 RepID=UPI0020431F6C|nr:uncharacterized protein LOC125509030 isoform X3 [Triticum urartu]XP_048529838.1 uncharacterized protein LOC125509030 isoform X3 [Triticum urartu]XP_048529839.1 uncharacterized protein LOC125509030 isoform X3 [Triticum urartu]XP_048529840.1 uncharacterized protein LOC125509030 isoform X3 [Triticum urartu]
MRRKRELHGGFTEGDGVDGEEEETEAGVLAALGWFQDREGKDFMLPSGGERAEDSGEEATRGAGEHGPCPVYLPHPPCFYEYQMQGFSVAWGY